MQRPVETDDGLEQNILAIENPVGGTDRAGVSFSIPPVAVAPISPTRDGKGIETVTGGLLKLTPARSRSSKKGLVLPQ